MRSSGPLGTSRMPVASTTIAPGRPRAKRSYQETTASLTKPSSVARQGTIAGTQVRCGKTQSRIAIGENSREAEASLELGTRPRLEEKRMRCGGRHMDWIAFLAFGGAHSLPAARLQSNPAVVGDASRQSPAVRGGKQLQFQFRIERF